MATGIRRRVFTGALAACLCAGAQGPVGRVESRMVLVPVTVTDRYGRPLTDLEAKDFRVFDGAEPRTIHSLWQEDAPASVGIVLDLSGSMRHKMAEAIAALREITEALDEDDAAGLITFADRPRLAGEFALDPAALPSRLTSAPPEGGTAVIDAVYMALHAVRATGHPRKALVVISDGADNASRYTEKELAALVVESDVQIYTIGIAESLAHRDERQGLSLLQDLSEMSGGLHFTVRHRAALPDAAAKATRAMKSLYMLAYRPPEGSPAGKWRKIKVAPAPGLNRAVRISAKTGYFEPD